MTDYWYPTAFISWGDEERDAINRVVRSVRFTAGEEVEAFETEFAAYHRRKHAIMVNSGSSANLVMVAALSLLGRDPVQAGSRAIVPAVAWSTTYAPLVQHGLDLQLVDIDASWNADPYSKDAVLQDASVVVGCSILGTPADLREWSSIAGTLGAWFIEDNCESLGARLPDGQLCGTVGLMATFSFFWSHQLGAIEGGMVLTDDEECAALCRMLRAHGWTRDVTRGQVKPFVREYDFRLFGYNVRPLEMHAAIGRAQLKKLDGFVEARISNAISFEAMVRDLPSISMPDAPAFDRSPFGIQFMVPRDTRERVAAALRTAGIDCRLPTGGSFLMHEYGKPWRAQKTPLADELHMRGMFIGNAPFDISDKIERAVSVLRSVFG